jgi:Protein of unknown function (DUF2845)
MDTGRMAQFSWLRTAFLVGLVWLSLSETISAEQRRSATPRHRTGDTETVPPSNTSTWRPYTNPSVLVTLGMAKAEVLLKAGKPALEELLSQGTDGHLNLTAWTYIRAGHNAATTVLTFQGNKLVRIDTKLNP